MKAQSMLDSSMSQLKDKESRVKTLGTMIIECEDVKQSLSNLLAKASEVGNKVRIRELTASIRENVEKYGSMCAELEHERQTVIQLGQTIVAKNMHMAELRGCTMNSESIASWAPERSDITMLQSTLGATVSSIRSTSPSDANSKPTRGQLYGGFVSDTPTDCSTSPVPMDITPRLRTFDLIEDPNSSAAVLDHLYTRSYPAESRYDPMYTAHTVHKGPFSNIGNVPIYPIEMVDGKWARSLIHLPGCEKADTQAQLWLCGYSCYRNPQPPYSSKLHDFLRANPQIDILDCCECVIIQQVLPNRSRNYEKYPDFPNIRMVRVNGCLNFTSVSESKLLYFPNMVCLRLAHGMFDYEATLGYGKYKNLHRLELTFDNWGTEYRPITKGTIIDLLVKAPKLMELSIEAEPGATVHPYSQLTVSEFGDIIASMFTKLARHKLTITRLLCPQLARAEAVKFQNTYPGLAIIWDTE